MLAGVILVVFQLQQNSDLLELQILKQDADSYIQNSLEVLPENFNEIWQTAIDNPKNLTRAEIVALDRYLWARSVWRWRNLYDLANRGLLEKSVWQRTIEDDVSVFFAHPFGRAYWADMKSWQTTLPEDLVNFVDQTLEDDEINAMADYIDNIERRLGIDRQPPPEKPAEIDENASRAE